MYMAVLDTAFVIMYNLNPKVVVSELQMDLACPEACFQATTQSECFEYIKTWISHSLWRERGFSVFEALKTLSDDNLDTETQHLLSQSGDLNLLVLIAGTEPPLHI